MMKPIDWNWTQRFQRHLGQMANAGRRQLARQSLKKHVVSYSLPYSHDVMVGITAESPVRAIATAEALFDDGTIWDDTDDVPLLRDDYDESNNGDPLILQVEETFDANTPWPDVEPTVGRSFGMISKTPTARPYAPWGGYHETGPVAG